MRAYKQMNLKEKANATYISTLFIAMKRKDTPIVAKIFAEITVGYALSPIDVVPDFIPVLGYLDDLIILPLSAVLAIKFVLFVRTVLGDNQAVKVRCGFRSRNR